jgi:hypothetical protein
MGFIFVEQQRANEFYLFLKHQGQFFKSRIDVFENTKGVFQIQKHGF